VPRMWQSLGMEIYFLSEEYSVRIIPFRLGALEKIKMPYIFTCIKQDQWFNITIGTKLRVIK
jgi:hypothetical protein